MTYLGTQPVRQKVKPFVSKKLRDFAKGQPCSMLSEFCNGDSETVVLCHDRRRDGCGMSEKPHDFHAYHGCSGCHAHEADLEDREIHDAVRRTQKRVYAEFGTLTP